MIKITHFLTAALLLTSVSQGFAQDQAASADIGTADTGTADAGIADTGIADTGTADASTLSIGEPVQSAEDPVYIRETSGDWQLECRRVTEGPEPCQLFQPLFRPVGNQVANIRVFPLTDQGAAVAGALIAVPLETMLTQQLTISVDGAVGKRYPFTVCDRLGCYAQIGFLQEDLDSFKRGNKAVMSIIPFADPSQTVAIDISLKGFTKGFELVSQ